MILFQQRRDFGEKLNATFAFVTENIRGLGLSLLFIVGPVALVGGVFSGYAQAGVMGDAASLGGAAGDPNKLFAVYARMFSGTMLIGVVVQVMAYILTNLVTFAYIRLYQERRGDQQIEVSAVWEETQRYIGSGVLLSIAISFITVFAMLLLIIPGIYVGIVLTLAPAILVFERKDVGQSISRSFKLITDKWWSTLGLMFVVSIVVGIMSMVFTLPAGIMGGLFGAGVLKDITIMTVIIQALAAVGTSVLRGLSAVAIAFQYFNLVELKEGTGLIGQIDSIGETPTRPGTLQQAREEEGEY